MAKGSFRLSPMATKLMLIIPCFTAAMGILLAFIGRFLPLYNAGATAATRALTLVLGLTLGALSSLLKVYLLERSIDKAMDYDKKNAQLYMQLSFIARTFLTAGVIIVGILITYVDFWGAVAGALALPASAYLSRLFFKEEFKDAPLKPPEIESEPIQEANCDDWSI